MHWLFYLTPIGWWTFYLSIITFVHELGHLAVGLLFGHKFTKLKIGWLEPTFKFRVGGIDFEFSGDANGGELFADNTHHVSQIGILLTAMAGPFASLFLGTVILGITILVNKQLFLHQNLLEGKEFAFNAIMMLLIMMAYFDGVTNIYYDFKNILKKPSK